MIARAIESLRKEKEAKEAKRKRYINDIVKSRREAIELKKKNA